jgi:hypothetical protein
VKLARTARTAVDSGQQQTEPAAYDENTKPYSFVMTTPFATRLSGFRPLAAPSPISEQLERKNDLCTASES